MAYQQKSESYIIVYLDKCNIEKFRQRYIGESKRAFNHCLAEHRGYIVNNRVDKAAGSR